MSAGLAAAPAPQGANAAVANPGISNRPGYISRPFPLPIDGASSNPDQRLNRYMT
jgi:hypothetical protein